jgi:hypothetical protein
MSYSDEGDAEKLERERTIVGVTMEPIIDHIQITVRDMATAEPFYDRLMPLLGFDLARKVSAVIDTRP